MLIHAPKAYVPNCKHDIFVSYARVDDEPFAGADKGWVTTLITGLKILLGKKLGSPELFSLWMDHELRGNTPTTPHICKQLETSALFVLILSPAYEVSQWCQFELNTLLAIAGKDSGRIFVVEHDIVEERSPDLSDLLGYKFWVRNEFGQPRILAIPKPNPEEFEYYQKLDDLARQLVEKLKELKQEAQAKLATTPTLPSDYADLIAATTTLTTRLPADEADPTPTITSPPTTTVFLAKVSENLEKHRQEVKGYLEQQGVRILPTKEYAFATLQQSLDQDLKECQLFVQLLNDNSGGFINYPLFQYQRAQAASLPILQWRDPRLNLTTVTDSVQRTLLEASTVMAVHLFEFQTYIIKYLTPAPVEIPKPTTAGDILVFINAAPEDMTLAHRIKDILDAHGIGYSLPLEISTSTKAAEIRNYLEQNLLYCDSIIVLYDNTSAVWVNEQLLYCRRMQRLRDQPLKIIAVYSTPSPNKPPLNIKLPNMQILNCPATQVESCLPLFLQSL
ncbi:extracellular ligand-binding receptor [Thioploca ingrica]|uniref:Extracellular ligand-binding receptor n=1 Tax=Thioploca ingrica TaxID=40754 RepID=A0A090AJQ0_9GAMM|nr:extracellular ligand-binding receptor [Thioploca ingrica]